MRMLVAAVAFIAACSPVVTETQGRETPAEIRRIIAQSLCLAEAYPASVIAKDADGIVAVYQGALGGGVTARELDAVRDLARKEKPAALTPVGNRNFAIARCISFADRADVVKLLGALSARK
jgi:hypothetical protein